MNLKRAIAALAILFSSTGVYAQSVDVEGIVDLSPDAYMLSQQTRTQLQEPLRAATTTQQRNRVRAEVMNNIQEVQARPEIPAGFIEMMEQEERNTLQSRLQTAITTQQRNHVRMEIATLAKNRYQSKMQQKYGASLNDYSKKAKQNMQMSSSNNDPFGSVQNFFGMSSSANKQGGGKVLEALVAAAAGMVTDRRGRQT